MNLQGENKGQGAGASVDERRSAARVSMNRGVFFSDYKAAGPLREGTASDMSLGGFCIVTRHPEALGSRLQVELRPSSGAHVGAALYEGEVVRVEPMSDGEFEMGIRLIEAPQSIMPTNVAAIESVPEEPPPLTRVYRTDANELSTENDVSGSTVLFQKVIKRNPNTIKLWRRTALGVIFALLIVLAFLIGEVIKENRQATGENGLWFSFISDPTEVIEEEVEPDSRNGRSASLGGSGGLSTPMLTYTEIARRDFEANELLTQAQAMLATENIADAEGLFRELERRSTGSPMRRFLSLFGQAESAALKGDLFAARSLLRRATRSAEELPGAWSEAAADLELRINIGSIASSGVSPMNEVIEVRAPVKPVTPGEGLWIDVDTGNYLMRVMRGDEVVRSFPVGLGRNGTTPKGTYTIANKISDPDWYNRGNVVPGGAPNNPLGSSWMGLGDAGSPTSYGIHPTANPRSISQPMSRGCVRMRPEDAEALFRVVPIGTPVVIHP